MEEHVNTLTAHMLLLAKKSVEDAEFGGTVNDTPGELLAEQYIQKRSEFMTLAEKGNHVFYTRTFPGTLFYTHMQTSHSVGIIDI